MPKTLVLVLDQAEEILTLGSNKEGEFDQKLFFDFIVKFSKACLDIKLIVTLRTEYFGYFFNELKDYWYDHDRFSSYLLKELSAAQLIEVIEKPISTSVPLKFLQGRCQPGEHYKFEFERGLTKQIVEDLKKYEAKGGIILPVLQIVCDRLFKQVSDDQVNKKVIVDKGLNKELSKVTFEDYRELDPFEEQMYSYVMSAILFKIENEVPGLNQVARNEEFELWMEFLCELVKAKPGNRASTDYKPSEALRASAENLNCKVKFEDMMNYLSNENRRILNQSVHLENSNSYPNSCYYSLGHDAIAVTLLKWIEARQLLLRPITQMDAFLSQLTSDIIDYTFNPHIEFTFCYPGLGIGSISVGGEVYNNYSAAIKNLIKNGHPKSTFILAECQELDSLYDAFLDEGDNNYVEMTPEKIRINFAKEESKVLQILVVDGSFGKNGMYNRDNAKGFDSSVHWWFVDTKFRFQAIILGDVVYIINTFGLPTNIGGQWRKPDSGNNHVEIVATRIKNHLLALQLHDQLVKEAAQYSKNLELAPQP
ncbi:MAG TPA: hypothetical protein DDY22_11555 [Geobacter sp.]|nr:hypothetical protein [Geobacter sp.]